MRWPIGQPPFQWSGEINRTSRQAHGLTALFHPLMHWRDLIGGYQMAPVGNAAATGVDARLGRTYSLDGTDDCAYVTLPDAWKLQRFTVAAWVKITATGGVVFSLLPRGSGNDARGIYFTAYTTEGRIIIGAGTGSYTFGGGAAGAIAAGETRHIVGSYDGSNLYYYVDGVLKVTTAASITISYTDKSTSYGPNPATAYIGAYHDSDNTGPAVTADILYEFNGQIGPVSLYNRALSAAEIWSLYDPQTRWELYQPPRPMVWWMPPATTSAIPSMMQSYRQRRG